MRSVLWNCSSKPQTLVNCYVLDWVWAKSIFPLGSKITDYVENKSQSEGNWIYYKALVSCEHLAWLQKNLWFRNRHISLLLGFMLDWMPPPPILNNTHAFQCIIREMIKLIQIHTHCCPNLRFYRFTSFLVDESENLINLDMVQSCLTLPGSQPQIMSNKASFTPFKW